MTRRFPLHVHISTLFIVLILLVGGVIGGLGYRISSEILETTANELNTRIGRETVGEFSNIIGPAEMATRLLSYDGITQARSLEERLLNLGFMREALNNSSALTSLYVGYGNGDFFMVRRIWDETDGKVFDAPEKSAFMVQSIDHQGEELRGRYIFLDAQLMVLRSDDRPDYATSFDPRTRGWYKAAMSAGGQVKTPPYLFFTGQKVGTTIANRANRADAVVGADIRLETLSHTLARQKVTPGTQIVLANERGHTIAFEDLTKAVRLVDGNPVLASVSDLGIPVLAQLAPKLGNFDEKAAQNLLLTVDGSDWHASIRPVRLEGAGALFLITAIPDDELMSAAYRLMHHSLIATILVILLAIPVTWLLARNISGPLRQLAGEAEAIRRFEFSRPIKVNSLVLEVNDLTVIMDSMKRTIRRFLDISMAVAAENDFDKLLPRLLNETLPAADADAGILYLTDGDRLLPAAALHADATPLPAGASSIDPRAAGPLLGNALSAGTARAARLTDADVRALGLERILDSTGTTDAIAVPLLNRQHNLVGAMLLLRRDDTDPARLSFVAALSGSVAVSLE
ncbi:MAG TPA: GAF domain-containing protein, partial [Azonexus sp.]|nr:GAF domain-containing protein [Azonexus sp.]